MIAVTTVYKQRGIATLLICMLMLLMITGAVFMAYALSMVNLQAVGNMQFREEAISAARYVNESVMGGNFTDTPSAIANWDVDIDNDDVADYSVDMVEPTCVSATQISTAAIGSVSLPGMSGGSAWNTVWELDTTATNAATGTAVRLIEGVRVKLTDAQKNAVCP